MDCGGLSCITHILEDSNFSLEEHEQLHDSDVLIKWEIKGTIDLVGATGLTMDQTAWIVED
jgi:hypothetical protein